MELDHITPVEKGGDPWDPENLQTLCRSHHIDKTRRERKRAAPPADPERRAWLKRLSAIDGPSTEIQNE